MKLFIISVLAALSLGYSTKAEDLAGKIWDVQNDTFISFQEMVADVRTAKYILLGERHGRTAHQEREAFLIGALVESSYFPSVALEMLTTEQTSIVQAYRQIAPEYALGLGVELSWADSNWPAWSYYLPIFEMAFTAKLPLLGADLPDESLAITDTTPNPVSLNYYQDSMKKAHCGLIDDIRALELAELQLARDRSMANVMVSTGIGGVLLIAGSSHIRRDTGIPSLLENKSTRIIALRETDQTVEEFATPPDNLASWELSQFDYVWFTPEVLEQTLCDRI